jgi:hypothetical protein
MEKQDIIDKIETIKEKLRLYLILDELMRKDPIYKMRCQPSCPSHVETDWNLLQLRIIYLEDKIDKYNSLLEN